MTSGSSDGRQRDRDLIDAGSALTSLEQIVRWCVAEDLPLGEVVAMDEFDHDLPVPLPGGSVVVFGCT